MWRAAWAAPLGQAFVGAGDDVDDPEARLDLGDLWLAGAGGAGEHVDFDALARELLGDVEDVHVHPPGVPDARLFEGRGVH